ncbi:MAG: BMP family ABC transporter substrate-binding protein, partial [Pseudomonadota bacterium]
MSFLQKCLGTAAALSMMAGAALAEPALMYDLGGKFDKSFNEAAYNGAQRWAEETGNSYQEIEVT